MPAIVGLVTTFLVATVAKAQSAEAPPDNAPPVDRPAIQTPPTQVVSPGDAPSISPPCLTAPTVLPQPARDCTQPMFVVTWMRVARVALEVVLGAATGAALEVGGAYVGLNFDILAGHEVGAGTYIGTTLGAILGVAPGVYLAGYAMGGDGSYGWTVLGSLVGIGGAAAILAIRSNTTTLGIAAALPVLGAIAGYELSSHERRSPKPERVSVVPVIGPTAVGLVGKF
jgi:hypothetical protein